MIDVIENIKKVMEEKGYSAYQASKVCGLHESHISKLLTRKQKPNLATLFALAKGLEVDVVRFFGYDPKPPPIIEHKLIISGKPLYGENVENFIPIPLLADPASLGEGLEIDENNVEGTCLIHQKVLRPDGRKEGKYRAIYVRGDSMSPLLEDDDIVAVDVKERNPDKLKGKLVACHTGDYQVTIKSLRVYPDNFYFKPFNPKWEEEHPPMLTPKKDGLILGKVVCAWKKFE